MRKKTIFTLLSYFIFFIVIAVLVTISILVFNIVKTKNNNIIAIAMFLTIIAIATIATIIDYFRRKIMSKNQ